MQIHSQEFSGNVCLFLAQDWRAHADVEGRTGDMGLGQGLFPV